MTSDGAQRPVPLKCFRCGEINPDNPRVKPPITIENGIATCSVCGASFKWPQRKGSQLGRKD